MLYSSVMFTTVDFPRFVIFKKFYLLFVMPQDSRLSLYDIMGYFLCKIFLLKVLWHCGVIQLTRGVKSSVWSGFKSSHGSPTTRVKVWIS